MGFTTVVELDLGLPVYVFASLVVQVLEQVLMAFWKFALYVSDVSS